ncbi:hypothetical protein CBP36_21445 (plasmid) [Acidovorax carolinensis]|uniref:KfrB domain-containing protein n=1 Tax=Acidovorax carolinensis TaxID=553814 RepID=A0A240UJ65_9BURK|nr:hypothetical protein [Acidovorax carolinensis]ART61531.1 hypothetical protein CBP36_21445 [Acidovorax carolinensis]
MAEKSPSQLPFAEFVKAVQPTGAVSRVPSVNGAADVYTYNVYMNGPLSQELPRYAQEHTHKDVTLQALTEKLQLNPLSARDNLKVAELVSLRSAWMTAVLENSMGPEPHSPEVLRDYTALSEGMNHPWIQEELEKQRGLSAKLGSTLARAGVARDVIPKDVSVGKVVAQTDDFTLQRTQNGEVVTHENRRLQALPAIGADVMVSYYRGSGQVVDQLEKVKFSEPFIDPKTEDLAVRVTSADKDAPPRVVLFNNVQSYAQFVEAHGLGERLVQSAFNVRALRPKTEFKAPPRKPVKMPYLDEASNCLAVDYEENEIVYTALFEDAKAMASLSREFNLSAKAIAEAHRLEELQAARQGPGQVANVDQELKQSELDMRATLKEQDFALPEKSGAQDRHYMGPVVAVTSMHVAQDIGRRQIVMHDIRTLDKAPAVGDRLNIRFKDGRGAVTDMVTAGKDLGR